MKIMDFLRHYGLEMNPFSEEDAQTDPVFKDSCIKTTRHPCWDKLYGSPAVPSTSLAFGEKGSGKTALRMQMIRELSLYNTDHLKDRPFVIDYSDMNPYLDHYRNSRPRRWKPAKILDRFALQDHLDAILSLGVTQLVDRILTATGTSHPAAIDTRAIEMTSLSKSQIRDLLSLVLVYDNSRGESSVARFYQLSKQGGYFTWKSRFNAMKSFALGVAGTLILPYVFYQLGIWKYLWWLVAFLFLLWSPWLLKVLCRYFRARSIVRGTAVLNGQTGSLFTTLMKIPGYEYISCPFPQGKNQENRYELLERFLAILKALDFNGMIVLVDRIDEPYLVNGSPQLMKSLLWPLLDNKLLKHEQLGVKGLIPSELYRFAEKESTEFRQRARLDKQNVIESLSWTGEALYDLVNARLAACGNGQSTIRDFFDPGIDETRLRSAFAQLRVPRHLFKFLYRLFVTHVGSCTEENPVWTISIAEFESSFATFMHDINRDD